MNAGYHGEGDLNWQAAEQAFKQTWGELDSTELSPAEALEKVLICPCGIVPVYFALNIAASNAACQRYEYM